MDFLGKFVEIVMAVWINFRNLGVCVWSLGKSKKASLRFKRGKKATESPSVVESRVVKRGKRNDVNQHGSSAPAVQKSLQMIYSYLPQRKGLWNPSGTATKNSTELAAEGSDCSTKSECSNSSKAGLRNSEVGWVDHDL